LDAPAGGALFGLGNFEASFMQESANDAKPLLEINELRCSSPKTVDRTVAGAQTDDGPASGDFIQGGKGVGRDGGVAIDHVGYSGPETDCFRIDSAESHDLIGIDIIHVAVSEKDRFKAELFRTLGALDGFSDGTRGTVQAKIHDILLFTLSLTSNEYNQCFITLLNSPRKYERPRPSFILPRAAGLFPNFEIRMSKSETIPKFKLNEKPKSESTLFGTLGHLRLFRASDFVLRIYLAA
jgi:hypothetical protein